MSFNCKVDPKMQPFIEKVLQGEYDVPSLEFESAPSILDLGANIGAFTYWALQRFPNAHIYAYEPNEQNVAEFLENMRVNKVDPWKYNLIRAVVFPSNEPEMTLYAGKNNCGEHSLDENMAGQSENKFIAPVMHPNRLPDCSFLKMDIEGAEVDVLKSYLASHIPPAVIAFEFHSKYDHYELDRMLSYDYIPARGQILHPDMGTLIYLHKNLVP